MKFSIALTILAVVYSTAASDKERAILTILGDGNALDFVLTAQGRTIINGRLGVSHPESVGKPSRTCDPAPGGADTCYEWGDYAKLFITQPKGDASDNCASLEWHSTFARRLEDCFNLEPQVHWYGGAETLVQTWPIQTVAREEAACVTGDFLQNVQFGGLLETYWLTSAGAAIHVEENTPLFTSWNTTNKGEFCLIAQDVHPYTTRSELRMKYDICVPKTGETFRDVHLRAITRYYGKPVAVPDLDMLTKPFWSTWAEYKTDVDQKKVVELAKRMKAEGYLENSHIEIDDNWEVCYGEAEFNKDKFPDPKGMVEELKTLGIQKTTLWIHPFVNYECPSFKTGVEKDYFLTDAKGKTAITWWWQGSRSGHIDFANQEAIEWWSARLERLRDEYGITSYKFDAGEAMWLPASTRLVSGDSDLMPNILSTKYVDAVSKFGDLIETRTAHRNQQLSMYFRMLDKNTRWGYDNGLQSLITTLLTFNVLGYSFVMPDMIGGNAYSNQPSHELYIRWAQATVFMPAWQFSILPWDRDASKELDRIVKASVDIRLAHRQDFIDAALESTRSGAPMNRPMWWVDPTDAVTFDIDDQFMLGDNILAAPVVKEGQTARDIYLPVGTWKGHDGRLHQGPNWLRQYPAPLEVFPYFIRQP